MRMDAQRRLAADSLKCCPLCGAVNALSNEECFVCRWHGSFVHDPYRVEEGLGELLAQCPELVEALLDEPEEPLTWFQKAILWLRCRCRRRIDFRV